MSVVWRPETSADLPDPGAVMLSCFPSAGLAPTVAGHYILQTLKLPRIGSFTSEEFPPLAVVQGGRVNPPVRAYGGKDLVLVLSEFPPEPDLITPVASAILAAATSLKAGRILGLEGVVPHPFEAGEDAVAAPDETVWYAGSGSAEDLPPEYKAAGVRAMTDGVIGGVSGALLVESLGKSMPVGTLLVSASDAGYPDHRAAAKLIDVIDQLLPHVKIDTRPLRTQAELIERTLRAAVKPREGPSGLAPTAGEPSIYQ